VVAVEETGEWLFALMVAVAVAFMAAAAVLLADWPPPYHPPAMALAFLSLVVLVMGACVLVASRLERLKSELSLMLDELESRLGPWRAVTGTPATGQRGRPSRRRSRGT